jgi:hypothetical protein
MGFPDIMKNRKWAKVSEPPGVFVASPQKLPMPVHNAHCGKTAGMD